MPIKLNTVKRFFYERKSWLIIVIGLLIGLSWAGSLDKYSDDYTNSAIIQAGATYAVARGINATVSMLQTSTINVSFGIGGSITIGEVLDPVNDLIERFSEVMTVALGSLALQKILLAIAANKLFSGLLTLLGALSILVIWMGKIKTFPLLLKLFVLLVVVRFSLGIVVLSNSAIDHQFLSNHIVAESAELGAFKESVNNLQREKEMTDIERMHIGENIKRDKLKLNRIQTSDMPGLEEKLKAVTIKLDKAEAEKGSVRESASFVDKWNPWTDNEKIQAAQSSMETLTETQERIEARIESKKLKMASLKDEISLNQAALRGDSAGVISKLNGVKQNLTVSSIEAKISNFVQGAINLLILFLLKAVLVPLMFFYLLMGLAKRVWRMDWAQLLVREQTAMDSNTNASR